MYVLLWILQARAVLTLPLQATAARQVNQFL
jgi:hypothetical protein